VAIGVDVAALLERVPALHGGRTADRAMGGKLERAKRATPPRRTATPVHPNMRQTVKSSHIGRPPKPPPPPKERPRWSSTSIEDRNRRAALSLCSSLSWS
jgi:hypothetical protein